MLNRILLVVVGALLLTVLWNTWTVQQLSAEVASLREGAVAQQAVKADGTQTASPRWQKTEQIAMKSDGGPRTQAMKGQASEAIDLENPDVRDAITQLVQEDAEARKMEKREQGMAMYMESVNDEIEAFADEFNLDNSTKGRVMREVERRSQAFAAVKNDVQDGQLSWFEARGEFRAIKEEGESNLRGILGDEQYEELSGRLWGGWGRGK